MGRWTETVDDHRSAIINQWDNIRRAATIQATMNNLPSILHDSALAWAKVYYQTDQVVVAIILEEGDEPDRYLALISAANQTGWQAAEVWPRRACPAFAADA